MSRITLQTNASWSVITNNGTSRTFLIGADGTLTVGNTITISIGGIGGTFTHSNTSSRTYTLLDRNGTIALQDTISFDAMTPTQTGNAGLFLTTNGSVTSWTSAITSLNGLTATSQTFATPGTTGTAPNWSSTGSVHTLNIPLASATSVTAGLLSHTDYTNIGFTNVSNTWGGTQTFTNAPLITNPSTASNAAATYGQVQAAAAGISVRPPVAALDSVDTTKPTVNPVIDGYTVQIGDRILFTNLTTGNNEIYVAGGTLTSVTWTLATDGQAGTGAPTTGDLVFVKNGNTYADQQWAYEGTLWVQFAGPQTLTFSSPLSKTGNTVSLTTVPINLGGTGQTTASAAFNALSPMTTLGDLIYGGTAGAGTRLPGSTSTTIAVLTQTGTGAASAAPSWVTATGTGSPVFSASPALTGIPTAPTAAPGTNTTQLATTAFVEGEIGALNLTTYTATLADNTAAATDITGTSFAVATYRSVRFQVQISRGAGNYSVGYIQMLYDGTNARVTWVEDDYIGTLGVTITGVVATGNMKLQYTTTSTGTAATMYFTVKTFNL